jgi:hypothetical protein
MSFFSRLLTRGNTPETRSGTEYSFFPSLQFSNRRKEPGGAPKPSPVVAVSLMGKETIQNPQPEQAEIVEKTAEAPPIRIIQGERGPKIEEKLNAIVPLSFKENDAFKNELAYLSRSDAHHDLGDLFKDTMYKKEANVANAFDSALPVRATVAFHEGDALASVIISATNSSGSTINIHTGNNKQEEYLLESLNQVPDCTAAPSAAFSTFTVGVGGDTIFKYRVVRFVTACSNNKGFKGQDLDAIACKTNFGKSFVTNTKLGEDGLEAAIIVDFSQHHFIEDLASGDGDNFKIHYLMTPEVVNDPAGKPNVHNASLFKNDNKGVKLISYVQTDVDTMSYTKYNQKEPSTSNNFFSNYDFTLSPIKQIFTKQKAEKLITTLNISYDGGTGKPLTDTIEDSKGENSITTVLGYLRKILSQIQGNTGGTPIEKFNFNSKIQQKRGGDWFQALSCLTAKNREFTAILPTRGTSAKLNPQCPVYLVTHDRIAVAYALLNGVNVIYLDYYGRIFIFKNGGDQTLKSSGLSMEAILFQGIKQNWFGERDFFRQVLQTAEVYMTVSKAYVKQLSDSFNSVSSELTTDVTTVDVSNDSKFQNKTKDVLRILFKAAIKLAFTKINLIDITSDYEFVKNDSNQAIFQAEEIDDENDNIKNQVAQFSKSINNIKGIQDRFGLIGSGDDRLFKNIIEGWVDSNSKKLDVFRVANNILEGREPQGGRFDIKRLLSIFSKDGEEERKTDQHIFLPFIQSLESEYKNSILVVVSRLIDKTAEYYTNVVSTARAGRTGISTQQLYYNDLANLLYESVIFLKTDFQPDGWFQSHKFDNNAKPLIEGKAEAGPFTSTDNIILQEDKTDLDTLKETGKFSGNTENAIDTLRGGKRYVNLSTAERTPSAICDISVKQVTWTLLTSLLVETTGYCKQVINFIKSEPTIDANLDVNLDEEGNSDIIKAIEDKIKRNTTIIGNYTPGDVRLAVRATETAAVIADVIAWKLDYLSGGTASAVGATVVALATTTEILWQKYKKKAGGGGDGDGDSSPKPNVNPLLDFNLGFHPLTPIYSMLSSYYNILGEKSQTDPFFYTYFTYINILEKMKRTLEENYLNDVNNKVNIMSAYMIGFGLYTMLYASHTSELQNTEILSVIQMSQKEYHEFSLKNDGFASTFSGAIHQTPEEEIVGMVLVNNKLFNNFINNEVNIKQILEEGTPVDNLPTFQVLKDGIFELMGEIVVKVNVDRGTPIASPPTTTSSSTASGIPGISAEERASRAALSQQKYEENKAKGLIKPYREPRTVTGKDIFKYSSEGVPVTSETSGQGTRAKGGKKKKTTRRIRKSYKNKTIKRSRKHKRTRRR